MGIRCACQMIIRATYDTIVAATATTNGNTTTTTTPTSSVAMILDDRTSCP